MWPCPLQDCINQSSWYREPERGDKLWGWDDGRQVGTDLRVRPLLDRNPTVKHAAQRVNLEAARLRHRVATIAPAVIRPRPRKLTIAITAQCNLRCVGCRYGPRLHARRPALD